ncbi:hypothetical protein DCAR_0518679 [Daucus carota subsp. sativus]|uniref:NADH-ubiquinone oxidoreductase chain 3 n=1 Tax=Daucus carota subsp. sativus TaxID=79200 RepID=A0AAF1B0H2_DAUCS|nr:hypothetical protein DCAR_0518679 [Daucus carota subsp. sativus]
MSEFAPICIYLVISPLVSLIPLGVPFLFASNSSTYPDKLSAYECGFDPFGDARSRFDIRFYLVSILFIIPDPEVTFSFPWAVPLNKIDPFGSWSMMAFLLILTIYARTLVLIGISEWLTIPMNGLRRPLCYSRTSRIGNPLSEMA